MRTCDFEQMHINASSRPYDPTGLDLTGLDVRACRYSASVYCLARGCSGRQGGRVAATRPRAAHIREPLAARIKFYTAYLWVRGLLPAKKPRLAGGLQCRPLAPRVQHGSQGAAPRRNTRAAERVAARGRPRPPRPAAAPRTAPAWPGHPVIIWTSRSRLTARSHPRHRLPLSPRPERPQHALNTPPRTGSPRSGT